MEKRVVIVDFNHLAHMHLNSHHNMSVVRKEGDIVRTIDTTVVSGVSKSVMNWSDRGNNPTVICFDSPVVCRKVYFAKELGAPIEYKGGRSKMSDVMYESLSNSIDLFRKSGVSCVKANGYEADDLIYACIKRAKAEYPGMPIDVITNDADLLPLVDDTVSIFLRSRKTTYAVDKDLEKVHYVQVTPLNFQEVVEDLTRYKKFYIPYNTILLHKLLRGDPSDNIPGVKNMYPPRVYNNLVQEMENDWVDFREVFRYGDNTVTYKNKLTGLTTCDREIYKANKDQYDIIYGDPVELTRMVEILERYIDNENVIDHVKRAYRGMNLNQAYNYVDAARKPAVVRAFGGFDSAMLKYNAYKDYEVNIR